jgi:predicted dehydrogenase
MKKKLKSTAKLLLKILGVTLRTRSEMALLQKAKLTNEIKIGNEKLDIYMVGCGVMGRSIAQAIRPFELWNLVEICDLSADNAKSLQKELAPKAVIASDYAEMLKSMSSNKKAILVIATTAKSHEYLFNTAVNAGVKKVFLEKPLAVSLAEGIRMQKLASEHGTLVNVDHVRRWMAPIEGVKRIIKSGTLGDISSLTYVFGRSGFAMIGTHLFDLVRFLFDADIMKIRGELDEIVRENWRGAEFKDQSGRCELLLTNGIRVNIDLSDNLEIQQDSFFIFGSKGRLEVDQRLQVIRLAGGAGRVWDYPYQWFNAFEWGLAQSLLELSKGVNPRCSLEDAHKALEATIAVHQSHRNASQWVELPLKGDIVNEVFPFA